jgi:hypothetical protein
MRCDNNMLRNYLGKIAIVLSLCAFCTIVNFQQLNAQVQGTETHVVKWLSASGLRSWFSNMGAEGEYFRRDRQTYLAVDQIDGLCWPNEFNIRMKGVKVGKSLWIGTTGFADPVSSTTYPHKVVCVGGRRAISGSEIFADELTLLGQFPHPKIYVDDVSGSARDYDDIIDREDANIDADRVMINNLHTSIGISVTRKIIASSQQYNNNYYIYDYTFTNTGIIDESGVKKLNVPLNGVVFYMQSRLAFPGVSYNGIGTAGVGSYFPAGSSWGRNTITDIMRRDGPNPGEFSANISYWGPMATTPYGSPAGDIGLPAPLPPAPQSLLAGAQFVGTVVLHADKSPTDTTDDITQPTTTMYAGADDAINGQPSQYNQNLMSQKYLQFMSVGHPSQTQAEQIGKDANGWPTGPGNTWGTDAGGYMATQGFGPYTLNPGQSIHIVVAEVVAGINWNKGCEVAGNWYANNTSSFVLPAGYAALKGYGTTTDRNEYKNAWVFSGKDSLFQAFRRAKEYYRNNYTIPKPPPPPDNFTVNSGGDRIKLKWSPNAESSSGFAGYRIYRSEGRTDTTYDLIYQCGPGVTSYDDQDARRGSNYYYYIQSVDNGASNPGNTALNIPAGEPLVSSRYYTMTNTPAFLTRPAGLALTTVKTFDHAHLIPSLTLLTNRNRPDDTVTSVSFRLPLKKSVLDSTGTTTVRGVSILSNGKMVIPGLYSVISDTIRFIKFPGAEVPIQLPARRDTVLSVVNAALASLHANTNIEVSVISPVNPRVSAIIIGDSVTRKFRLPEPVVDAQGNKRYDVRVTDSIGVVSTALYSIDVDTLVFLQAPGRRDTMLVELISQVQRNYKLSEIRVVPNPYNIKARNIQFGQNDPTSLDRLGFFNLPPVCNIKIYNELGDLIVTIKHNNGSGDEYWNSLTSSRQVVVSGLYIAYFEVTQDGYDKVGNLIYRNGDSIFKKFIIIR